MKILIDINHPAHVHYFRNFYRIMTARGHQVLVLARNKEIEHKLLSIYKIPFINRGKGMSGMLSKFFYMVYADVKIWLIARRFRPDVFLNFLHPYPSHVSAFTGKVSIVFSDTEHATLHHRLTVPFATKVFTPSCYRIDLGPKQERFNGYMELSYLHPSYFTPDPAVLKILDVREEEKFVIVRFVSWAAAHDVGHKGMSLENKHLVVKELSKHARVFISSEGELPEDLEAFRIRIPVDKMHDALYYSALLFGESATMASEAAVLGTPSIFIDNDGRGYTDEEERVYGLVHNFNESAEDQRAAIECAIALMTHQDSKGAARSAREKLLKDKIDTTAFMIEQVSKYATR